MGEDEEVDSIEPVVEEVCESMEESETTTDSTKTVQTLMTMNDVENLEELKEQHRSLCREVKILQEQCQTLQQDNTELRAEKEALQEKIRQLELNKDLFKNNDERVHYYTGLTNWNLLLILIQFVHPFLNVHGQSSLSAFQQVTMTLMRLRVGHSGQDLGYRFGIHRSTVPRIFSTVIDVLFNLLKHLIIWPKRDILRKPSSWTLGNPAKIVL